MLYTHILISSFLNKLNRATVHKGMEFARMYVEKNISTYIYSPYFSRTWRMIELHIHMCSNRNAQCKHGTHAHTE